MARARPAAVVQRKYFTVLAGLIALFLGVQSALEMSFAFRENKAHIASEQVAAAWAASARIESYLDAIAGQLREVAALPWTIGRLGDADRRDEFHRLLKLIPAVFEIRHFDREGRETLFVSRTTADRVRSGLAAPHPVLLATIGPRDTRFGSTYFTEHTAPSISLAVASTDGTMEAEINLKFVADVIGTLRVGAGGRAFVVDADDNVIAHPNLSLVLAHTHLSALAPGLRLSDARAAATVAAPPAGGAWPPPGDASAARAALVAPAPIGARVVENDSVLMSSVPVAATGWRVYVHQPYAEALQPVFATLYRTLIFLVLGLAVAFVASWLLARRLTGPILRVRQGAARIAAGDLDARISVDTGDEVQALADDFNDMAAKLKESYAGLERKVLEKTHQLERANRHKSDFVANMSHELRTPLNAVIGFSEVLKDQYFGPLNDRQIQYAHDIHESGTHLLSLINDILDLSKVEAGRMDLDMSQFNLPAAIDNALVLVRERALRQRIALAHRIDPGVDDIVADERKLKQILINLLTNAVKFSRPGDRVEVRAMRGAGETIIEVSDDGIGIAPEDQTAIFEEFRQIRDAGGGKHEGTGLGLALVKRFVELHGGRIDVESERDSGSTFRFTLPDRVLEPASDDRA